MLLIRYLFFILMSMPAYGQDTTFNKLINFYNQEEQGESIIELNDGYLILADCNDFRTDPASKIIRLVKTNQYGDTLYNNTYNDSLNLAFGYCDPKSFKAISGDNMYGLFDSGVRYDLDICDFHFFLFNDSLDIKLHKVYKSANGFRNYGRDFVETKDYGYALVGYRLAENNRNNASFYLIKTDSLGNKQWEKTYFSSGARATNILNAYGGGYIISGTRRIQFRYVPTLLKVDSIGSIEWYKNFGNQYDSDDAKIILSSDSTYIIFYSSSNGNYNTGGEVYNPVVKKLDVNGNELWSYNFEHDYFANPVSVKEVAPGSGYIITGIMYDQLQIKTGEKFVENISFLFRLDNDGNLLWERRYAWFSEYFGRHFLSRINSVVPTKDNGFVCTGFSTEHGLRRPDIWLLKLDSLGCMDDYCGLTDTSCYDQHYPDCGDANDTTNIAKILDESERIKLYPNPAQNHISIEVEDMKGSMSFYLYNIEGKKVLKQNLNQTKSVIDISGLESGYYLYGIERDQKLIQKDRLIILD